MPIPQIFAQSNRTVPARWEQGGQQGTERARESSLLLDELCVHQ